MRDSFDTLLPRLRAVAEPSRLRLLAVLAHGEFAVTELTAILGQSQPRVSRHLKLLDDCGLLERFREQHWIYYRVAGDTEGGRLARQLLGLLDPADPVLAGDELRLRRVLEERAGRAVEGDSGPASTPAAELVPIIEAELGEQGHGSLLYFGRAPDEVLGRLGTRARRIVGMNASRNTVQRARALLHSAGMNHCVLQQGQLTALPHPPESFDVVVVDRALAGVGHPEDALREAARVVSTSGRVVVIEDFDELERRESATHPLALLRSWLADAGLACERLCPCDVSGAHLLLASASPEPEPAAA